MLRSGPLRWSKRLFNVLVCYFFIREPRIAKKKKTEREEIISAAWRGDTDRLGESALWTEVEDWGLIKKVPFFFFYLTKKKQKDLTNPQVSQHVLRLGQKKKKSVQFMGKVIAAGPPIKHLWGHFAHLTGKNIPGVRSQVKVDTEI